MKKLDEQQRKNLLTGVKLATELNTNISDMRAFISIFAYQYDIFGKSEEVSKFLNSVDNEEIFFQLRKYEINKEFIEKGWYPSENDLINSVLIKDIQGLEIVEQELLKYMNDLSILRGEWECDNLL